MVLLLQCFLLYFGINRCTYFQEKSTLCNNFIQKRGVNLFPKVDLFRELTVIQSYYYSDREVDYTSSLHKKSTLQKQWQKLNPVYYQYKLEEFPKQMRASVQQLSRTDWLFQSQLHKRICFSYSWFMNSEQARWICQCKMLAGYFSHSRIVTRTYIFIFKPVSVVATQLL